MATAGEIRLRMGHTATRAEARTLQMSYATHFPAKVSALKTQAPIL